MPLDETIRICVDTLYSSKLFFPDFPKAVFIKPLQMAASEFEFSFSNTRCRQNDGIVMGSPLGLVLANICVGYHENKLFELVLNQNFTNIMWMTRLPFLKMKPSAMHFSTF